MWFFSKFQFQSPSRQSKLTLTPPPAIAPKSPTTQNRLSTRIDKADMWRGTQPLKQLGTSELKLETTSHSCSARPVRTGGGGLGQL